MTDFPTPPCINFLFDHMVPKTEVRVELFAKGVQTMETDTIR